LVFSQRLLNDLVFQSFNYERTWRR
jgi:hypothetical protein